VTSTPIARKRPSRQSRAERSGTPWAFHSDRKPSTAASSVSATDPFSGRSLAKIQTRAESGSASKETMGMRET